VKPDWGVAEQVGKLGEAMRPSLPVLLTFAFWSAICGAAWQVVAGDEPVSSQSAPDPAKTSFSLEEVRAFDSGGSVFSLSFANDRHTLLLGGDTQQRNVKLWDVNTGQTVRTLDAVGLVVACAPDQPRAVLADSGDTARLYSLEGGKSIRDFAHNALISALAFSPDGRRLATASMDKVVCVWEVETGKELLRLKGHEGGVTDVAFTPDGQRIVSSSEDKTVRVWDAASGSLVRSIVHPARVWRVAVSPDGKKLLTGTGGPLVGARAKMDVVKIKDNAVRLWDLESGDLLHKMKGHTHAVLALDFHPTLPLAASGGIGKVLILWDLNTAEEICRVQHGGWVASLAFSPDGENLITGGGAFKRDLNWVKVRDERIRQFRVVPAASGTKPKLLGAKADEEGDEPEGTAAN
jgi:WD40 repeat protein